MRQLKRQPFTTSFPSGHAASAAAFATGVALESRGWGAVVAPVAVAVAASRVYTGVHYPGDVLAGVALGIGAAFVLRGVVPTRGQLPAPGRPPTAVPLPAGKFSFKPPRRRTARTAAVGALAAAACVTVMAGSASAIVNGSDSTESYLFMATIPESAPDQGLIDGNCGASLIDQQWVLTAAHCLKVEGLKLDGIVRVGSDHRKSGGTVRKIDRTFVHPGHVNGDNKAANKDDIALVRLDRPVPSNPSRSPSRQGSPARRPGSWASAPPSTPSSSSRTGCRS